MNNAMSIMAVFISLCAVYVARGAKEKNDILINHYEAMQKSLGNLSVEVPKRRDYYFSKRMISRVDFVPQSTLTAERLNSEFNTVYDKVNEIISKVDNE